jgi:hypothetical protein
MTSPPRRTRLFALASTHYGDATDQPITMDSAVVAVSSEQPGTLPDEWQAALRLCPAPRAVAEIASCLALPLTTTIHILTDLAHSGLIHHRPPMTDDEAADVIFLSRVRDALNRVL